MKTYYMMDTHQWAKRRANIDNFSFPTKVRIAWDRILLRSQIVQRKMRTVL
jgi:hypothetical protein